MGNLFRKLVEFQSELEKRVERENDVESVSELEFGAMEGTLTIEM